MHLSKSRKPIPWQLRRTLLGIGMNGHKETISIALSHRAARLMFGDVPLGPNREERFEFAKSLFLTSLIHIVYFACGECRVKSPAHPPSRGQS